MGLWEAGGPGFLDSQSKLTPQLPHLSKTAHLEGGSHEGQEHEVMETQAMRGGPHVPWERDELWAPFISTQLSW